MAATWGPFRGPRIDPEAEALRLQQEAELAELFEALDSDPEAYARLVAEVFGSLDSASAEQTWNNIQKRNSGQ